MVMSLLGIAWVFGFFIAGKFRLAFQYFFSIANSLQGFIIFIVCCLQHSEARNAWITFLRTGELQSHHDMKNGGTSSLSHQTSSINQPTQGTSTGKPDSIDRLLYEVIRCRSNQKRTQSMRTETIHPSCNVVYTSSLTLPHTNTFFDHHYVKNTARSRSLQRYDNIYKEDGSTSCQSLVAVSTATPTKRGYGVGEYSLVCTKQQSHMPPPKLSISSPEWLHSSQTTEQPMTVLSTCSDSNIVSVQLDSTKSHNVNHYPHRRESNETSTGTASQSSTFPGPSTTPSLSTSPTISPTSSCCDTQIWSQLPLVDTSFYKVPKRINCEELL